MRRALLSVAGIALTAGLWAALLLLPGCAAPLADEPYALDTARIQKDTEYLCSSIGVRVTGTEKETAACDWLQEQLEASGFSVEKGTLSRTGFEGIPPQRSENLTAVCNPDSEGPLFSIVAHYDSVPTSPGARDNAASVAVLLEMARLLGPSSDVFSCEIRMVFLGSEENGYHGSRAYVEGLSAEDRARHLGAFNMDISAASPEDSAVLVCYTLGGTREDGAYAPGNFLEPVDNHLSAAVAQAYQELYSQELGGVYHVGESDHISFHNAQLDAVNVCWRRVEAGTPQLPDSYHQMSDTAQDIDFETARTCGRCILKAISMLTAQADTL